MKVLRANRATPTSLEIDSGFKNSKNICQTCCLNVGVNRRDCYAAIVLQRTREIAGIAPFEGNDVNIPLFDSLTNSTELVFCVERIPSIPRRNDAHRNVTRKICLPPIQWSLPLFVEPSR